MNEKFRSDKYEAYFSSYDQFIQEQKDLDDPSHKFYVETKGMELKPFDLPTDVLARLSEAGNTYPPEVLYDLVEGSGFAIEVDSRWFPLRECAMPSLKSSAEPGNGTFWLPKARQASHMTECLQAHPRRSYHRVLISHGGVAAIVSPKYMEIPIAEALGAVENLDIYFGEPKFIQGYVSHSLTTAIFEYPESTKLATDAYGKLLASAGRTLTGDITPVLEFRSSDTSGEACKLLPYLKWRGRYMPVGKGVHVRHELSRKVDENGNRLDGLALFEKGIQSIFSIMMEDMEKLVNTLLSIPVNYPGNTFIGLCKFAQIPQKWGGEIEMKVRREFPDNRPGCTMLDLYDTLLEAIQAGVEEAEGRYTVPVLNCMENIGTIPYKAETLVHSLDHAGTTAWSQKIN